MSALHITGEREECIASGFGENLIFTIHEGQGLILTIV
jgi:hypothetical protein